MKAILGSVERDVADAFAYIPYGLAAAVVFLLIMILYNRKKYGRVSFIIKSSLMIIYVVVVGHLTLFSRESGIVDRVDLTFFSLLEESSDYTIQLIENVLLFLPAGILCPWMWKQIRNWKRSFLLGFAGSLLIETLQMLTAITMTCVEADTFCECQSETRATFLLPHGASGYLQSRGHSP